MLNLERSVVENNVLNNVLPYIEHIETKELLMHIVTIDMAVDMNAPHAWINTILAGTGLVLIGTVPILSFWGILGATSLVLGTLNFIGYCKDGKVFDVLRHKLISYLMMHRDMDQEQIIDEIKNIQADEYLEFLENSIYMNLK